MSRLFDLLERVNEKFPPDETSNSEEARKRRRSQIIGRVIGKTDTAEVQTEETLRRVGLPMAEVATWQIEAALRATGGVISKAAEKLRVHSRRNSPVRPLCAGRPSLRVMAASMP